MGRTKGTSRHRSREEGSDDDLRDHRAPPRHRDGGDDGMRLTDTSDLWWKTAVFYNLDVKTYLDADDDGIGDLRGLAQRLDHLAELGVTCLWLAPFYPSPQRDNGYDIEDYYGVDPRYGSLGDMVEVLRTVDLIREMVGGDLTGKRIACLGAAFKPNSDDVRDAPALDVARMLYLEGATVTVHDPEANENAHRRYPDLNYAPSMMACVVDADAVQPQDLGEQSGQSFLDRVIGISAARGDLSGPVGFG